MNKSWFWRYFRFFVFALFADDPMSGGGATPQNEPQNNEPQTNASQGNEPQNNDPQGATQQNQGNEPQAQNQNSQGGLDERLKALEEANQKLANERFYQEQVEKINQELKKIEAKFPDFNAEMQKQTVEAMAQEKNIDPQYLGSAGAFLYYCEKIKDNPNPPQNMNAPQLSKEEQDLIKKSESGERLTREERILLFNKC